MYAFILMIAVLQGNGDYATFSETYVSPDLCIEGRDAARKLDLSATDAKARVVYAECVRVEASK